jgi:hypothetical protein
MSGPPKVRWLHLFFLVSLLLLACEPEADAPVVASALASASPTADNTPASVDISGCWRGVNNSNVVQPLGSPFQLIKIAPNAFVFQTNPSRTKLVVKQDLTFKELNLDENRPFFPKGTEFSSGTISEDNAQISRSFAGDGQPHIYRRCEKVNNLNPVLENSSPLVQATPSVNVPIPLITPLVPGSKTPPPTSKTPTPTLTPLTAPVTASNNPVNASATPSAAPQTGSPTFPFAGPLKPISTPLPTPIPPEKPGPVPVI